jgi:hypothetical protein
MSEISSKISQLPAIGSLITGMDGGWLSASYSLFASSMTMSVILLAIPGLPIERSRQFAGGR